VSRVRLNLGPSHDLGASAPRPEHGTSTGNGTVCVRHTSLPFARCSSVRRVCCRSTGGQETSIECCTAGSQQQLRQYFIVLLLIIIASQCLVPGNKNAACCCRCSEVCVCLCDKRKLYKTAEPIDGGAACIWTREGPRNRPCIRLEPEYSQGRRIFLAGRASPSAL